MAEQLIPDARRAPVQSVMASTRSLLVVPGSSGRATTRGFACYDHARDGADGLISIVGGKTITARLMAEKLSDMVCAKMGAQAECRTRAERLLSDRAGIGT
jgi:glycerol-3-phosphate dehydrogenase